jgi:hypothetical protein
MTSFAMTSFRRRGARRGALAALAVATLAVAALAGCSGHPSATAGPSPSALGNDQVLAIGQQAAQCMREHGIPDFPDPVVDQNGELRLPQGSAGDHVKSELNAHPEAQQACQPILDRLPARATGDRPDYTQEDLANLLKFAQCMRQHGIADFPDPKADGSFPLAGTTLEHEGKSARVLAAMQACKQYWDKGIVGS